MRLPISLVQAIRQGKDLQSCPNCARMLYIVDPAPRRLGAKTRRSAPRKVGVARFSSETLMSSNLDATDAEGAIRDLATKMELGGYVDKAELLVELALRREAILSTAVEDGIAFPHVRGVEGGGLTLALGTSTKGVKFDNSGKRSHIIFFIVIPTAASAFYLTLLSGLARSFGRDKSREAILAEKTPDGLWKMLCKLTRTTVR
jgi:mannitol/fructose-specific phosphotransferase system IIA component (Ntr-type)